MPRCILRISLLVAAIAAPSLLLHAQSMVSVSAPLPDAPQAQQTTPSPDDSQSAPGPKSSGPLVPPPAEKKPPTTDEILRQEETQRILGIMPAFQVVDNAENIPPMRPGQKFSLMWKSSTDPFVFALDGFVALVGQADDSNSGSKTVTHPDGTTSRVRYGFEQGVTGYMKRFGASYADTLDGNFWGNAVLPVLLREDPRYFRMGTGSFPRRFLYSASTTIWARRDNGKWGPNYANVAGNFISGAISNFYYPKEEGGLEKTAIGAVTVTIEGTFGAELIEFWPDIERHLRHKHALQQP